MRKICFVLLGIFAFSSCQKTISDFDPSTNQGGTTPVTPATPSTGSGSFEATVDGQKLVFNVIQATLLRSTADNEKRIDIVGVSADGKKRLIITLGEETAVGNSITVKKYILNGFPDDDPATPNIDESLIIEGFTTYSVSAGTNSWLTDIFDERGTFTVTNCDAGTKLISGSFETILTDFNDNTHIVKITAGKLTNIKYTVVN